MHTLQWARYSLYPTRYKMNIVRGTRDSTQEEITEQGNGNFDRFVKPHDYAGKRADWYLFYLIVTFHWLTLSPPFSLLYDHVHFTVLRICSRSLSIYIPRVVITALLLSLRSGEKSFPDYEDYANQYIYDINIPGCGFPGRVFAGQRQVSRWGCAVHTSTRSFIKRVLEDCAQV